MKFFLNANAVLPVSPLAPVAPFAPVSPLSPFKPVMSVHIILATYHAASVLVVEVFSSCKNTHPLDFPFGHVIL